MALNEHFGDFWPIFANFGHFHHHAHYNTRFSLISLKGMYGVSSFDHSYGPKLDAKPQKEFGRPCTEHKYNHFKDFLIDHTLKGIFEVSSNKHLDIW